MMTGPSLRTGHASQAGALAPVPIDRRSVGIAYSLWHQAGLWRGKAHRPWGTPELGLYSSNDPLVLTRHADWLGSAGVDFVVIDWSNDLGMDVRRSVGPASQRFIEQATLTLFEVWGARPSSPKAVVMIGNPGAQDAVSNGQLRAKADEVHDLFVKDRQRARLLQNYLGKTLLLVYADTPSPWPQGLPPWTDDRFTVRFVTGFLTDQTALLGPDKLSRYGYWSWEDRGEPSYAVFQGHPECMTVVAAWRGPGSPGRNHGQTYVSQWKRARELGPRFVLAGTFNEWWVSEQVSQEGSKDIEPSLELGHRYLDILAEQVSLFKPGL